MVSDLVDREILWRLSPKDVSEKFTSLFDFFVGTSETEFVPKAIFHSDSSPEVMFVGAAHFFSTS